jgi:hypothetical protein
MDQIEKIISQCELQHSFFNVEPRVLPLNYFSFGHQSLRSEAIHIIFNQMENEFLLSVLGIYKLFPVSSKL